MTRHRFSYLSICFLFAMLISSCGPQQLPGPTATPTLTPIDFEEVRQSVSDVLYPDSGVSAFVLCHLQPALWGGYDVVVQVSSQATKDSKPHDFEIKGGQFTDTISSSNPSSLATVGEEGHVFITSQDEAFEKGIPYFISDVRLETPTQIKFIIHTNPNRTVENAVKRIVQSFTGDFSGTSQLILGADPIAPSTEPQEGTYERNVPLEEGEGGYFSLATPLGDESNYCLVSNEIDLSSIEKK